MAIGLADRHLLQESTAHAMYMYGRVDWLGDYLVECSNANGQKVTIDWENGPTPVQLTLQMVGACSLADIVEGLKQRDFDKVWIEMESERADSAPKVFTSIHMTYHIRGDVPRKLVERIVEKSHEKYCTVSNMIKHTAEITSSVEIHPNSS
jgi:putative redox protein